MTIVRGHQIPTPFIKKDFSLFKLTGLWIQDAPESDELGHFGLASSHDRVNTESDEVIFVCLFFFLLNQIFQHSTIFFFFT